MATRNKLKGVSAHELAKLATEGGQKRAAAEFGVSQAAVSIALRKAGYEPHVVWRLRPVSPDQIPLESAS